MAEPADATDPAEPGRFAPPGAGSINPAAAVGFERGADDYERARPSYPAEAVALVVDVLGIGPGRRVLDLAAGTGKFTRLLAPTGAELVAVEPVAAMRAQLQMTMPGLEVLDGTAEHLPLPDASVDAVVVAQAFHWFDAPTALAAVRRVLRGPGQGGGPGGLALVWNQRDAATEWVLEFDRIMVEAGGNKPYVVGTDWSAEVDRSGRFGPLHHRTFTYEQTVTPDLLVTRAASTSFVSALPDAERQRCLDRVRELALTHPDLAGRATFAFPYLTDVFWCEPV